jgi:hypothetical protein
MNQHFTDEEILLIMEIGRVALSNPDLFWEMSCVLDFSEPYLKQLRDKLELHLSDTNLEFDWKDFRIPPS